MMRAPWATHFGFTKLPFSKNVSAKDLLDRASHQEAVARIRFCIAEALLGVSGGQDSALVRFIFGRGPLVFAQEVRESDHGRGKHHRDENLNQQRDVAGEVVIVGHHGPVYNPRLLWAKHSNVILHS